jgi:ACS family allantoate permease-like MFS transporter
MLVGLPGGAISFCLTWIGAFGPRYFHNTRCLFGAILTLVPMLGALCLLVVPAENSWGIVASTWFAGCTAPPLGQAVGLMASNVKGNTKKSVIGAIFFVFYCVGCITGPQLWQREDAPRYSKGLATSVTSYGLLIILFGVYNITGRVSNKKRDNKHGMDLGNDSMAIDVDSDLTEMQDTGFRFAL